MANDTALTYSLYGKDVSASKALKNVGDEANKAHSHFANLKTTALGVFAGNLLTSGATALVGAIGSAVSAAADYQKLGFQTAAVLKSTGNAANTSVKGIQDLAGNLEQLSGVDEALIINSENVLATFTKVNNGVGAGNDVFDQATKAALNMSSALGTDLQGTTIQVGKALNDPIKGITALSRAGVSFTEQQKSQIKAMVASGDTMGAQKLILGELSTEFGGAAEAAGKGFAGSLARLKDTVSDAGRNLATKLLPTIADTADALNSLLKGDFTGFKDKMEKLGEQAKEFGIQVVQKIKDSLPAITEQLSKWANEFAAWIPTAIIKFIIGYANFAAVVINKIVDLLPIVTEKFQQFVGAATDWIGNVLPIWTTQFLNLVLKFADKITASLPTILDKLSKWQKSFSDWIPGAITKLLENVSKLGAKLSEWISLHGADLVADLVQWAIAFAGFVIKSLPGLLLNLGKVIIAIGKWIIMDGIPMIMKFTVNLGIALIEGLWKGVSKSFSGFVQKFVDSFDLIKEKFSGIWSGMGDSVKKVFEAIGNIIKGFFNTYIGFFNFIIEKLNKISVTLPTALGGESFGVNIKSIPMLAQGGVVNSPTLAMIGEAGPEAVVPLSKMGSGLVVNITVQGSVIQEKDLAITVRDNIAQLMRRRGLNPSILGV